MNYLLLVNKNKPLAKDYIPHNLVKVKERTGGGKIIYLERKTYQAIKKLLKEMNKNFKTITVIDSGYRPFLYQENLLKELIKQKGKIAYELVAKPGYSEHQTGLAVDVGFYRDNVYDENFVVSDYLEEFKWIQENASKYGFIIRYPLGKEKITGYQYEPWHLRYIGKEALTLQKFNLTLEEYLSIF